MLRDADRKIWVILALSAFLVLFLPAIGNATSLKIGGTGSALGGMRLLLEAFESSRPEGSGKVLPSLGSGGGIKALLAGAIDVAVSARPLKDKERAAGARAEAYAKTAIVLATPRRNTVTDLTSTELVEIYAGSRTTWADGTVIRIVLRPDSETDAKLLKGYVPEMVAAWAAAKGRQGIPVTYTDQETADKIQDLSGGLGPITLSLVLAENRPLKILSLDGVAPTIETIADGSYTMTKTFYWVTAPNPSELVQEFITFARSAEGTAILQGAGHLVLGAEEK